MCLSSSAAAERHKRILLSTVHQCNFSREAYLGIPGTPVKPARCVLYGAIALINLRQSLLETESQKDNFFSNQSLF